MNTEIIKTELFLFGKMSFEYKIIYHIVKFFFKSANLLEYFVRIVKYELHIHFLTIVRFTISWGG